MRLLLLTIFVMVSARHLPAQIAGEDPSSAEAPVEDVDAATIARIKDQALAFQWHVGYMQSIAQADFRTSLDSIKAPATGYGFSAEFGRYFDPIPLYVGGSFGVSFYPSNDRSINASSQRSYSVSTSNFSMPVLGVVRFQPSIYNWVYPYAEAFGGITVFSSDVTVRRIVGSDTSTTDGGEEDFSWTYGVGLGASFKIADIITLPNSLQRTLIDIGFRYTSGGRAIVSYADLLDETTLDYEVRRAEVLNPAMVIFRLGLTFQL
ncbi:MAG: PorT family protein [Candidatus Kapabacteria bacterium]|nr:PorT family protein [Candidatus Kapabacteria bacterium]